MEITILILIFGLYALILNDGYQLRKAIRVYEINTCDRFKVLADQECVAKDEVGYILDNIHDVVKSANRGRK